MANRKDLAEERIRELYAEHGTITPDIVVEDAKSEESPLHDLFEWDVEVAAMQAWRETARRLIRSVKVIRTIEDIQFSAKSRPAPEFVRDPSAGQTEQGYARAADLRTERDRAMSALLYEIDRADGAIQRAKDVAGALGLSDEIQLVASAIATVKQRAKGAA